MNVEHQTERAEYGISDVSVPTREQGDEELDFDSCTFGNGVEISESSLTGRLVRHFIRCASTYKKPPSSWMGSRSMTLQ